MFETAIPLQYPCHVVRCPALYQELMYKLYPSLSVVNYIGESSFIAKCDIKSPEVRTYLRDFGSDYVVMSDYIYDVELTQKDIYGLVLAFRHNLLKSRNTIIVIPDWADEVEWLNMYMYGIEGGGTLDILELFDLIGSKGFGAKLVEFSEVYPVQVLLKSFVTYIQKTREGFISTYYRKQNRKFAHKLKDRLGRAVGEFNHFYFQNRIGNVDELLLSMIKLHNSIFV